MDLWAAAFWSSVFLIAYTYVLYPLVLIALDAIRPAGAGARVHTELPRVAVVIAVFNEEALIEGRIRNLEASEYPSDKLSIVVGSDGSTDGTNTVLAGGSWRKSTRYTNYPVRRGKAAVLNDLVAGTDADIIVFSDANASFRPDTIARLVAPFAASDVGAVCGELILRADRKTAGGQGESIYWRYENVLKRLESNLGTTIGSVGPAYAVRRRLFRPLPTATAVVDDFLIPLDVIRQGYRVWYEPSAIAYERPANSVRGEFTRKARIGASNFEALPGFVSLLTPRYGFAAFALWSHKVLRWFVPLLLIVVFASSLVLSGESRFFTVVLRLQLGFLLMALTGLVLDTFKLRAGIFGLAYYFLATNAALLLGLARGMRGRQRPTWDIVR